MTNIKVFKFAEYFQKIASFKEKIKKGAISDYNIFLIKVKYFSMKQRGVIRRFKILFKFMFAMGKRHKKEDFL